MMTSDRLQTDADSACRSRALAIAPSVGFCAVYKLRPVDELKSEIDSFNPRKPDSFQPSDEVFSVL